MKVLIHFTVAEEVSPKQHNLSKSGDGWMDVKDVRGSIKIAMSIW